MKIRNVINHLEVLYPKSNASEFDKGKIGLQIGDENLELSGILLSLDLNKDVVEEAVKNNLNLIITHHPFIFNPLKEILFDSPIGEILHLMFKHKITLYVMHTNLDVGYLGVNDVLAEKLGFINYEPSLENVMVDNFLRYGQINPQSLISYANDVCNRLSLSGLRVAGDLNKQIEKVAVIGGSGGKTEEIDRAIALGCDCLVTGEVSLHVAQYATVRDFSIIEVSHGVEKFVFESLLGRLSKQFEEINIIVSKINTDPFVVINK